MELEALFGQFMAQTNRALISMEKGMEQMQTEMSELIAIFSSLYLPIEVVNRLSKNGIFAMAMSDSVMSILNYEDVMQRS